jgi:hypothetical protein
MALSAARGWQVELIAGLPVVRSRPFHRPREIVRAGRLQLRHAPVRFGARSRRMNPISFDILLARQ